MHRILGRAAFALLLAVTLLTAASCSKKQPVPASSDAPDFTLPSLGGEPVQLSKLKGNVVLLDFWATWCPPCRAAIPHLSMLQDKYRSRGLVVLGMNLDTDDKDLMNFVNQNRISYTLVRADETTSGAYRVSGIPRIVLIDRKGGLRGDWVGFTPEIGEEMEKSISTLLDEPAGN
jgi:thiol-disulfide isomerase/thioredoxin